MSNTTVPDSQSGSTTTSQAEQLTPEQLTQIAYAAINHESLANKRSYSEVDSDVESEARASKRRHIEGSGATRGSVAGELAHEE